MAFLQGKDCPRCGGVGGIFQVIIDMVLLRGVFLNEAGMVSATCCQPRFSLRQTILDRLKLWI